MIANEMHHRFNLLYEGGKLFNRTFNERETSDFLTKAQIQVVLKKIAPWKNRSGLGMGANNIRFDELAGLITGVATLGRDNFIQGTALNGALPGPARIIGSGPTNPSLNLAAIDNISTAYSNAYYNYGVFVPVPDECVYILTESCTVVPIANAASSTATYIHNVPIKRISHVEYQSGITDKYAKPYANMVWSMDWGAYTVPTFSKLTANGVFTNSAKDMGSATSYPSENSFDNAATYIRTLRSLYLIPGESYEVLDFSMSYVKLPAAIVVNLLSPANAVDSELAEFMHEEIVQEAVALASASIMPEPNKYQVNETEVKDNE
jgi:hypothetical protein